MENGNQITGLMPVTGQEQQRLEACWGSKGGHLQRQTLNKLAVYNNRVLIDLILTNTNFLQILKKNMAVDSFTNTSQIHTVAHNRIYLY